MSLFETKDLVITKANIATCYECSEVRFFIDMKNGKSVSVAKSFDEAVEFAKVYQGMIG